MSTTASRYVYLHPSTGILQAKHRPTSPQGLDLESFRADVVNGLSSQQKTLPSKYFYDERGSQLFDQICILDEYYLTRTELAIMRKYAHQMGSVFLEPLLLIEFGSGSSLKTRLLLQHLPGPLSYMPVDISHEHLYRSAASIAEDFPDVDVTPVCADFTTDFALPRSPRPPETVIVFFPGSTIGNFNHDDARQLLQRVARLCGPRGSLIIGIDLQKDPAIIEEAYNDRRGITAQFNLNLLARINRELKANFELHQFVHRAEYNSAMGRIEMNLISRRAQSVRVGDRQFFFAAGETICTEYSHKYQIDQFAQMAATAGMAMKDSWLDAQQYFAVLHFAMNG